MASLQHLVCLLGEHAHDELECLWMLLQHSSAVSAQLMDKHSCLHQVLSPMRALEGGKLIERCECPESSK